jgi:sugar phosphate isomerase/epimerase
MKISCCWLYAIARYGYPPSIEDTFRALEDVADMGFKYVEIEAFNIKKNNVKELHDSRSKIKEAVDNLGLKLINYPIMLPGLLSQDDNVRKYNFELFNIGVETASYFGAEMVQLDSFPPSLQFIGETPYEEAIKYGKTFRVKINPAYSWQKEWDTLINMFSRCCEILKDTGLKLILEPRVGEKITNADAILRLFDHINNPILGAILDTAHMHAQKEIIPLSIEKLGSKIFMVHVADNDGTVNNHNKVGTGTIDWEGTLMALKKFNYSGYFAIDIWSEDINKIKNDYIESRNYIEKIGKRIGI